MAALHASNWSHDRRRLLRERVRTIADQNRVLMDQIITALAIDEKDEAEKGDAGDTKHDSDRRTD